LPVGAAARGLFLHKRSRLHLDLVRWHEGGGGGGLHVEALERVAEEAKNHTRIETDFDRCSGGD